MVQTHLNPVETQLAIWPQPQPGPTRAAPQPPACCPVLACPRHRGPACCLGPSTASSSPACAAPLTFPLHLSHCQPDPTRQPPLYLFPQPPDASAFRRRPRHGCPASAFTCSRATAPTPRQCAEAAAPTFTPPRSAFDRSAHARPGIKRQDAATCSGPDAENPQPSASQGRSVP